MASTIAKISWLIFLLCHLGVPLFSPPQLFCENVNALYLSVNPMFHGGAKNFDIDYHFV